VPGVLGVDAEPMAEQPGTRFVIRARRGEPVQGAVAALVVGRGWTLLEVRTVTPTLEDLFVRAVQ